MKKNLFTLGKFIGFIIVIQAIYIDIYSIRIGNVLNKNI